MCKWNKEIMFFKKFHTSCCRDILNRYIFTAIFKILIKSLGLIFYKSKLYKSICKMCSCYLGVLIWVVQIIFENYYSVIFKSPDYFSVSFSSFLCKKAQIIKYFFWNIQFSLGNWRRQQITQNMYFFFFIYTAHFHSGYYG